MAKKAYVGVSNVAKKVKKIYVGVNGIAKKVKKGYVGVNGVARLFYNPEITSVSLLRSYIAGIRTAHGKASFDDRALFAFGTNGTASDPSELYIVNKDLTTQIKSGDTFSNSLGAANSAYACFTYAKNYAKAYSKTLTGQSFTTGSNAVGENGASTTLDDTVIFFGGGRIAGDVSYNTIFISNTLTVNTAFAMPISLEGAAGATDNYAINVLGIGSVDNSQGYYRGVYSNEARAYDANRTATMLTLPTYIVDLAGTSFAGHALFAGGLTHSNDYGSQPAMSSSVFAYDDTLTRTALTSLSVARMHLDACASEDLAIICGGLVMTWDSSGTSISEVSSDVVEIFDKHFTKQVVTSLSEARFDTRVAMAGDNFVVYGGNKAWYPVDYTGTVDIYEMI